MGGHRLWWMALVAAFATACADGPDPDREERLEQLRREGEALHQAADDLEDRLLADQANLQLWQELARRHQQVSAVVTRTQLEHFSSMVRLMEQQEEKARRLRRRHYAGMEPEGAGQGGGGGEYLSRAGNSRAGQAHH